MKGIARGPISESGQLFSGDIAIATMVFLVALSLAFFMWNSVSDDINKAENLRNLEKTATESIEQLIRTPGLPDNWNYGNVVVPGLATTDRTINETKALYFLDLMNSTNSTHYDSNRWLMGVGGYEFFLNVTTLGGDQVYAGNATFSAGRAPEGAKESISLMRTVIYNDEIVRISFIMWI